MTGIAFPQGIEEDNEAAAAANAALIQTAIDAAGPGTTIRLPNFKFYCDQLNIPANNPGLILEGGGKTLIINRTAVYPNNLVVFRGFASRIADAIGMADYLPGEPDQNSFRAYDVTGGNPDGFAVNDVMYISIPFHHQTVAYSRIAQMTKVTGVQAVGDDEFAITLEDDISMEMGAPEAKTTVVNGELTEIEIEVDKGGRYYSAFFNDAVHQPRVTIALPPAPGDPAAAEILLDAPLHKFFVTEPGSGYNSAPDVILNPSNGAEAHAVVEGGEVIAIVIDNPGAGFVQSPDVTLQNGGGSGAEAVVTIGPSDTIEFDITNPGSNYSSIDPPSVTVDPPLYQAKWVKDGTKVIEFAKESVKLEPANRATEERYPVDSIVWLCNGPAFNDSDGQYYRVRGTNSSTGIVTLNRTVRAQDVIEDLTCLVPGPFIERLTIRNLQIGGLHPDFASLPSILLSGVYDLTVENVQMVRGDDDLEPSWLYFTKTQFVRIENYEGLGDWQTSHNCSIADSRLTGLITHSNASDFTISRCRIGGPVRPWYVSERFTFRDCVFAQSGPSVSVNDDFSAWEGSTHLVLDNCTIESMGWPWVIEVPGTRISNLRVLDGIVILREECQDCVLENVRMEGEALLIIDEGSTGRMSNVQPDPGPIDGWFSDNAWLKLPEITAPATVDELSAVVFARHENNKTQLCARFPSGAVQPIVTEP